MSDAAKTQQASAPERIRFAASPLDPLAGRFTLERSLTGAPLHFPDATAAKDTPGRVDVVEVVDGELWLPCREAARAARPRRQHCATE